jgi:hypothetical protein
MNFRHGFPWLLPRAGSPRATALLASASGEWGEREFHMNCWMSIDMLALYSLVHTLTARQAHNIPYTLTTTRASSNWELARYGSPLPVPPTIAAAMASLCANSMPSSVALPPMCFCRSPGVLTLAMMTYKKTRVLLSFPYVCPEPVLAK